MTGVSGTTVVLIEGDSTGPTYEVHRCFNSVSEYHGDSTTKPTKSQSCSRHSSVKHSGIDPIGGNDALRLGAAAEVTVDTGAEVIVGVKLDVCARVDVSVGAELSPELTAEALENSSAKEMIDNDNCISSFLSVVSSTSVDSGVHSNCTVKQPNIYSTGSAQIIETVA